MVCYFFYRNILTPDTYKSLEGKNITSSIDLILRMDDEAGEKNMYGTSVFHRNMYYRNKDDMYRFLTINGINQVSPDVWLRNVPINEMYKKDRKQRFYIIQPLTNNEGKKIPAGQGVVSGK